MEFNSKPSKHLATWGPLRTLCCRVHYYLEQCVVKLSALLTGVRLVFVIIEL